MAHEEIIESEEPYRLFDSSLMPSAAGTFQPLPQRCGNLRGDRPVIGVSSDLQAVAVWIQEKARNSSHTGRSYLREAERLLLWASEALGKSLSELNREDFIAFEQFLRDPQPREKWVMETRHARSDPRWRPFFGVPSERSRMQSLRIIHGLISYLTQTGWFYANPMPSPGTSGSFQFEPVSRSLSEKQVNAVREELADMKRASLAQLLKAERLRWWFVLGITMGLRISEVSSHTMGAFRQVDDDENWQLTIERKGGKKVTLPVPSATIYALTRFRSMLDLPPYPAPDDEVPLAPRLPGNRKRTLAPGDGLKPVGPNAIHKEISELLQSASERLRTSSPSASDRLRNASYHWLRHTALTKIMDHTNDIRVVQMLGSHQSINTSATYTRIDQKRLRDALEEANKL